MASIRPEARFPSCSHGMDESQQTLFIACRFTPLDQWFVTHVNPKWKIRTVKYWLLKRCGAPNDFEFPQPQRRPPSPIVFAQVPQKKKRAISPIQFAQTPKPGLINSDDEAVGYEEDDEESDAALPTIVHPQVQPPNDPELPPVKRKVKTRSKVIQPYEISPYDPDRLTLLRFATGQVLEEDFTLDWYNIAPNELLEVHRAGVFLHLPRAILYQYVQPYWEGWVKALRVVGNTGRKTSDTESQKLEWRPRWVVVRDGELSLCKDRMESPPSKSLSLAHLTDLRGAEHLIKSTAIVPEPNQRIICAKFKIRSTTTRVSYDEPDQASTSFTTIISTANTKPPSTHSTTSRKRASTISHTPIRTHATNSDSTEPEGDVDSDSTLSSPVFAHEDLSEDDLVGSENVNTLLGLRTTGYGYRYRGTRPIPPSTPPNTGVPSTSIGGSSNTVIPSLPTTLNYEIGEWIVLDLPDDNAYTSLLRTLHRQFPHDSQNISDSSTFVSGLLPNLESPSDTPPSWASPQPPSTKSRAHPQLDFPAPRSESSKPGLPSLPKSNALGAIPFPEWRTELVRRARRAGLGNIADSMGCLVHALDFAKPGEEEESSLTISISSEICDDVGSEIDTTVGENESVDVHFVQSDSEDSDSSQTEWTGWMGDLHRQGRLKRTAPSLQATVEPMSPFYSLTRQELEPSGWVLKGITSPPHSPPFNSLSSPSSNESLYRRSLRASEHRRPSMPSITIITGAHVSRQEGSNVNLHSRQSSSLSQRPSMPSLTRAASVSMLKNKGKQKEEDPLFARQLEKKKKKNRLSNPLPESHDDGVTEKDIAVKKKRGLGRRMEKIINGLDPTLDFVDTR